MNRVALFTSQMPATLYSQSDTVFPDVLRSRVLGAAAADPVCSSSGIAYGNGRLWAGVRRHGDTERFEIYAVNLPAASVQSDEGLTFVCRTGELRSVVHRRADGTFRFRFWNAPRPISEAPDLDLISERSDIQAQAFARIESTRSKTDRQPTR